MDNDEMDKLLRNQDPLLYDSVMHNLYNVKSIEDFKDKGKRLGKRDIGLETPAIYLLVFNPDPEISWSNIDIQLTGRLYKSDGTPVIDLFEALITIYQVIHAEFDYQLQKNNVERWMDNRLKQFDEWIYHLVGEELNNRKQLRDKPQTFKDLFKPDYRNYSENFKQILRDVTPTLIDEDNVWIKNRNIARLFYDRMVFYKVMEDVDRKHVAKLFASEFSGVKAATFQDNYDPAFPPNSHKIYLTDLNERIEALKATIDNE